MRLEQTSSSNMALRRAGTILCGFEKILRDGYGPYQVQSRKDNSPNLHVTALPLYTPRTENTVLMGVAFVLS